MALCSNVSSTDQKLEAMNWYFGERHCRTITFSDDTAGDQAGDSFDINVIDEDYAEKKYLVWLDDGVASAPTPAADQTLIGVSYTQGDSASVIAAAVAAQFVTSSVEVRTEQSGADLEIQNHFVGEITTESIANAPDLTSTLGKAGFGGYLGQVGEGELTIEETVVQLLDDAQGATVLDEIMTGVTATIAFSLREMTTARWEDLIGAVGGSTVTIDSTDITGYGTEKLFQSKFLYAGRLVGHPVRLENSDRSADLTMLLTAPKLTSLNFSGAAVQEAAFEFVSYKKAGVNEGINMLARGDHSLF